MANEDHQNCNPPEAIKLGNVSGDEERLRGRCLFHGSRGEFVSPLAILGDSNQDSIRQTPGRLLGACGWVRLPPTY